MNHCIDCRYSKRARQLGNDGLFCRFEPPKTVLLPPGFVTGPEINPAMPLLTSLWPQVDDDAGCGRWERDSAMRSQ